MLGPVSLMDPGKVATANHHMRQSPDSADDLLVIAFRTLRGLLWRGINAIGRKIFRADDRRAHQHGWQIIPRHGGLGRTYRDPRFDYLAACTTCNGHGRNAYDIACSECHGTGRVFLVPDSIPKRGQGRS